MKILVSVVRFRPRAPFSKHNLPLPGDSKYAFKIVAVELHSDHWDAPTPITADNGRLHLMARQSVALSPQRQYVKDCVWEVPLAEDRQQPRHANRHGDKQIFVSFSLTLV
ncbi:MAG: hypothetical protein GYB27_17435 [Rhodobacteraceae bacterium]|nr:hypothetical protein [Paracoccaceae bacterium]